jgi:cell wall-associated NlpC family hydrolase
MSIEQELVDFTKQWIGTPYSFGAKVLNKSLGIDCSGWVHQLISNVIKTHPEYNYNHINTALNTDAADQINAFTVVEQPTATVMLVGIRRKVVPSWAAGRPRGISHIAVYIEDGEGNQWISQSAGSVGGVNIMHYNDWVQTVAVDTLYFVDPLTLA